MSVRTRSACGGARDIIEEYARHVGHADLIRAAIDGRTGEDPPGPVDPYEPPAKT